MLQLKDGGLGELHVQLRRLRMLAAYAQARELIRAQPDFQSSPVLQRLYCEHQDFWWTPLIGKRATLKRRCAADAEFVRACWADVDFMRKFNRFARPLPQDDEQLRQLLDRERASLLSELKALHWTIHTAAGPIGFVSATEHSLFHRRCEFIIGVLNQRASPVPPEATRLAIGFLRDRAEIERITAFIYSDNAYAAKVAAKFGFEREGLLKNYVRDSDGSRVDVTVFGLTLASAEATARIDSGRGGTEPRLVLRHPQRIKDRFQTIIQIADRTIAPGGSGRIIRI